MESSFKTSFFNFICNWVPLTGKHRECIKRKKYTYTYYTLDNGGHPFSVAVTFNSPPVTSISRFEADQKKSKITMYPSASSDGTPGKIIVKRLDDEADSYKETVYENNFEKIFRTVSVTVVIVY